MGVRESSWGRHTCLSVRLRRRTWTDLCRIFHKYRSLSPGPKIQNQIWCWPLTRDYMIGKPGQGFPEEGAEEAVSESSSLFNSSYLHLMLALDSQLYDLVAVSLIFLSPTVHIYTASPTPQIYPS